MRSPRYQPIVPLTPFLTRLLNEHIVPRTVEDLVLQSELDVHEQRTQVADYNLTCYALGLSDRLAKPYLDTLFRVEEEVEKKDEELKKLREELKTEREALVEWLDMRIRQQHQALEPPYISAETKRVVEIEIGLLEKYKGIIVEGGHRPDPELMEALARRR